LADGDESEEGHSGVPGSKWWQSPRENAAIEMQAAGNHCRIATRDANTAAAARANERVYSNTIRCAASRRRSARTKIRTSSF